jgi:hypothetical protein
MIWLLLINLSLILFDWLFASQVIKDSLREHIPVFFYWYDRNIHANFLIIDLYFVSIFLIEFIFQWILVVIKKRYHRWFFYLFIHWYDLLGCIPVGSFRFIRILRVFSILVRLHKLKIIDIRNWYIYEKFTKYLNIATEEISDRVVINVIEDIQDEIRRGNPLTQQVINTVIKPHKETIVMWLSQRLQGITKDTHDIYDKDIQNYVEHLIQDAVERNQEINTIEQIPILGRIIADNLEKAISDIVFNVIDNIIRDLASTKNRVVIENITDRTIDTMLAEIEDEKIGNIAKDVLLQALDLMKVQVSVQQWEIKDMEERERRTKAKLNDTIA